MTQAIYDYFPAETKLTRPKGGFILWLELPEQFDSLVLYEEALAHNIQIAPGVIFSPGGNYRNCLRLSCGLPWSIEIDSAKPTRCERAMQTLGLLCQGQLTRFSKGEATQTI
jgi:DNA-binding transcriptional MocR family regulator